MLQFTIQINHSCIGQYTWVPWIPCCCFAGDEFFVEQPGMTMFSLKVKWYEQKTATNLSLEGSTSLNHGKSKGPFTKPPQNATFKGLLGHDGGFFYPKK